MESNTLSIWTVYDHPSDFPDLFVARRFENLKPTMDYIAVSELEDIRKIMRSSGLFCLARAPQDDPKIIETWI
ncbi:MAG: hypothetical protein ACXVB1_00160 [Pseudobdellovibrionaceae bacterium]